MSVAVRVAAAILIAAGVLVSRAKGENEGQGDLDQATETRLSASTITDLSEVIRLLESALQKGLDEGNSRFARQMLASARVERALSVTRTIFGAGLPDPRWPQFRQLALGDLERSLELDANQPPAWLAVAELNLRLPGGDERRGAEALDQAIERAGEDSALKSQALLLRSLLAEDPDKKLADLAVALEADPESVAALRARAAVLAAQENREAALADLDKAIELAAKDAAAEHQRAELLLDQADLLIELGRLDEALSSADRARELAPQSADPLLRRGQILGLQDKFDASLEALNAAYTIEPDNLAVLLIRSGVLQALGRNDDALADVDQVLKLRPGFDLAIQRRVQILSGSEEGKEVIRKLETLQKSAPEDVDVALQLAIFYNAEGRPRKAIEVYTEILEGDPQNGLALRGRGDALLAVGKHKEAIADFEKALALRPDDPSLLNNFAWVLATSPDDELRDGRRALELATKACERTDYKAAHILSTLASAHAELGDFETAARWSEKAVALGEEDQKEQLAQELESYRQKKPWRERQETPEMEGEPPAEAEQPQPELPPEPAPPAPEGAQSSPASPKSRLIILADMGNEPDEEQQMVHMLMYSNEFDLEGLVAVTGKFLYPSGKGPIRPDLFHKLIDGYAQVYANLQKHASGWPSPQHLHGIVREGQSDYGIEDVGEGKTSPGSKLILEAALNDDPRPLVIVVNAGSNTLAQALFDYRAGHAAEEVGKLVARLRVYENGAQDNAGAWIVHHFPEIHWIRSNYQTYGFMGHGGPYFWKPYPETNQGQHQWAGENIQTGHGPLGALYPDRFGGKGFLEGGGTTPWIGLVNRGLYDPDQPSWGGWGGRFTAEKQINVFSRHKDIASDERENVPFAVFAETSDRWTDPDSGKQYDDSFTPVWRWRRAAMEDFKCRMDWCVEPPQRANHNPVAVVDGDSSDAILRVSVTPGQTVSFDASGSRDPDAGQTLRYSWWIYREPTTWKSRLPIEGADAAKVTLRIPAETAGARIHLILDVSDDSPIAAMHDYRRIVLDVVDSAY